MHVTGSAQDPHLDGFIDIKNGGFGVPDLGGTFTGLTTRIELQPDRVRIQQFQLLDHHGEKLTIAGELAVHERQVGAVNISIDSDNFELVDNELGDVQAQMALKVTGELRRPRVVGRRAGSTPGASRSTGSCSSSTIRTRPKRCRTSSRRSARSKASGSAEEATQAGAGESASSRPASPGAVPRPRAGARAGPASSRPSSSTSTSSCPTTSCCAARTCGRAVRPARRSATSTSPSAATCGSARAPAARSRSSAPSTTVRGTYEFQGRRFDLARGGTIRFIGTPTINPLLDITATRKIPNTGVEAKVRITGTPQGAGAGALERPAARGERHPLADRVQPPGQRARARASARRSRRRPAGSRPASSPRRSASRSARRSTSISSRSRRRPTRGIWARA